MVDVRLNNMPEGTPWTPCMQHTFTSGSTPSFYLDITQKQRWFCGHASLCYEACLITGDAMLLRRGLHDGCMRACILTAAAAESSTKGISPAMLGGIVIGVAAGVGLLLVALVVYCCRRRRLEQAGIAAAPYSGSDAQVHLTPYKVSWFRSR